MRRFAEPFVPLILAGGEAERVRSVSDSGSSMGLPRDFVRPPLRSAHLLEEDGINIDG